jgi:hypothetical protein
MSKRPIISRGKLAEPTINKMLHNVTSRVIGDGTLTAKTAAEGTQNINNMDHVFHKVLDNHYPISLRNRNIIARYGNDEHKIKLREIVTRQKDDFK